MKQKEASLSHVVKFNAFIRLNEFFNLMLEIPQCLTFIKPLLTNMSSRSEGFLTISQKKQVFVHQLLTQNNEMFW